MAKTSDNARLDDSTFLAGLAVGVALALGAVVLLAGTLASFLTGGGFARATDGLPQTIVSAITGNPDEAFAPAPPVWAFWTLFAILTVGCILLAAQIMRWLSGRGGRGAQWGGGKVERQMAVTEDPAKRPNRITIGRGQHSGKILAARTNISVTAIGVPGSAKTVGLVLPNAAEWQGPAVVTTAKPADLDQIYARRRMLGPVWVIAPAGIPGRTTHHWSPVDYCRDAKAADRMAGWMAEAASSAGDPRAASWVDQATAVLKGILLAANCSGGGVTKMREWLALGEEAVDHVVAILEEHGHDEVARDYSGPWLRLHPDGKGSIQFTLNVLANVYKDDEVRETASRTDFTAEEFLARTGTVCLIASESDAPRFAPLLTAIIASIIHAAEDLYKATGQPLNPSLGLFIDEAGNMLRYKRLPNILTVGRGMGIALLTIWHDLSQLRETVGERGGNTVLSASGMRMLLPGCGDPVTLNYFKDVLSRTEVERVSRTSGSGGSNSSQYSFVETDLAPVHELRELDAFTAVAIDSNKRPVKVNMRVTFHTRPDAPAEHYDAALKRYMDVPDPDTATEALP